MLRFFFLFVYFFPVGNSCLWSQNARVGGIVRASDNSPFPDAIVQLLRAADSSLVKMEFSDAEGAFGFQDLPGGEYLLLVHAGGGPPMNHGPVKAGDTAVEVKIPASHTIAEVQVNTRKPFIERERGKLVLNVEQSVHADGSSAYEILEKAPGVRIDNNDNVSLNGRPGTVIYIDGKPSQMTGNELANYLRAIGSSSIEKIELIANPSAKYDAAGSAIINIRMKKDKRVGTNGNANTFFSQGVYPKAGGGLSFNHREKKLNLFASYNYNHRDGFTNLLLDRQFFHGDTFAGAFDQNNLMRYVYVNQAARGGADYYIDKRNTFGIVVSAVNTKFAPVGKNSSDVFNPDREQTGSLSTENRSAENWTNFGVNLNFNHVFDSAGSDLTTDIDFARYANTGIQDFTTRFYDLFNSEYATPYLLHGDLRSQLDIYALKNDIARALGKKFRLEGGQKSSYVIADSRAFFFDRSSGSDKYDSTKSNHFIYRENINAAYLSVSGDIGRWSLQAGLRMEHTAINGRQVVYDSLFRRNYVQWFPNAVVSYKFNDVHGAELNFHRRIRRPGYQQLNPFKFYLDPTTYQEGNPYLLPQTTNGIELSHIYRQKVTTTIAYGRTADNIIETIAPLPGNSRVTVQTNQNLAQVDVFSFNLSVPVEVKKWWYTSSSLLVYYAGYSGNIANTPLRQHGNVTWSINSSNTFNFGSQWSAELSGFYNAREIYAYDVIRPRWFINAGIQRRLWEGRGTARLNFNDILFTNVMRARVDFTGYTENFKVIRDTRQVTVSFSWKFGKNTVPGARRRQGGADDLKSRVGGAGG